MVRNLMYLQNLKSMTTFFNNKNRINTWKHPAMRNQANTSDYSNNNKTEEEMDHNVTTWQLAEN